MSRTRLIAPTINTIFGASSNALKNGKGKSLNFRIRRKKTKSSFYADDNIIYLFYMTNSRDKNNRIDQELKEGF